MSLYVFKFGGSSVATVERMKHVAYIISTFVKQQHQVVVVTSAMKGETDRLISLARNVSLDIGREYDVIISTGEVVAAGMLARSLQATGIPAMSLSAYQLPIQADGSHGNASITCVDVKKVLDVLNGGVIPVITGFQGVSKTGDILTLGRGGSDATACALSYFLDADECFIYTDVDGVYTGDPHIALNAQLISEISYDEMLELSFWGTKVLQYQSVELAKKYQVKVRVLSSFTEGTGTLIHKDVLVGKGITGVAHSANYNLAKISNIDNKKEYIALNKDVYLIPKGIKTSNVIDINVGSITVVGSDIERFFLQILQILHSKNIFPTFTLKRDLSVTYIVKQTQIELGVNSILNFANLF